MSISGCSVVHDLVSKEDMGRMVGDGFSEASWDSIAKSRDKIPRSEIMDLVQEKLQQRAAQIIDQDANVNRASLERGSIRSEAILSFLMCCDRGGKQLLASYPTLGPRKGGAGPEKREGVLRIIRETGSSELRRVFMEMEARLCMAEQRGIDVDLDSGITDKLLVILSSMDASKLSVVCEALLKFAAADKGQSVRQLNKCSQNEITGGSDETKVLISFVDQVLRLVSQNPSRLMACKLVGHAFQLLTGLLVDKSPSSKFADASGGKVFDAQEEEDDSNLDDLGQLEGTSFSSRLAAPLRHEVMVSELKERGNRCMKKKDFTGAVAAYTSALGRGLWVEQAMELVAEMTRREEETSKDSPKFGSTEDAVTALLGDNDDVDVASRDLLIAHAKSAAALLANRSLAYAQLGKPTEALEDARLCLRCAPTWPKAHFRLAVALKLLGQHTEAISVLQAGLHNLSKVPGEVSWVKEFEKEMGLCKVAREESSQSSTETPVEKALTPDALEPLGAADWEYSDIMSWQFATFIIILMLLAGYLGSLMLLSFSFSAAMAVIFGAPDPRRRRLSSSKHKPRLDGDDEDVEEEDDSVYETEAGILLSQWMSGGSGSARGVPQRSSSPISPEQPNTPTSWLPRAATEALRLSDRGPREVEKPARIPASSKISKLSKIEKLD